MSRARKDGQYLNCRIAQPEYDGLVKLCDETGLTKTTATEKALKQYVELYHGYSVDESGKLIPNVTLDEYLES